MEINFHSSDWQKVYQHAKEQIQTLTNDLVSCNCDEARANILRGKIEALRELIELDKERFKSFSINPFN